MRAAPNSCVTMRGGSIYGFTGDPYSDFEQRAPTEPFRLPNGELVQRVVLGATPEVGKETQPRKEPSMFTEVATDVKGFIRENKSLIYFVALALLVDHFFFNGAFKARLEAMAEKMVQKVEAKVHA